MATPNPKYSDAQIEKLLKGIHDGSITERNLPEDLYYSIADYLKKGLYEGFGSSLSSVTEELEDLLVDLRDNVHLFAAAKTYSFTEACIDELIDDDGEIKPFDRFYKDGSKVFDLYNKDWAKAEYNTTIGQSQMANQWQTIEANKHILPMLTFSTAGRPCPECAPFEGLTAHVNSKVWNTATPLLHFNCACILIPGDSDTEPTSKEALKKIPFDNIPEDFRNNPGKTGEIFTKAHEYFKNAPKDLAKNNFGLDVPDKD